MRAQVLSIEQWQAEHRRLKWLFEQYRSCVVLVLLHTWDRIREAEDIILLGSELFLAEQPGPMHFYDAPVDAFPMMKLGLQMDYEW
jgi:hypothetical protein